MSVHVGGDQVVAGEGLGGGHGLRGRAAADGGFDDLEHVGGYGLGEDFKAIDGVGGGFEGEVVDVAGAGQVAGERLVELDDWRAGGCIGDLMGGEGVFAGGDVDEKGGVAGDFDEVVAGCGGGP